MQVFSGDVGGTGSGFEFTILVGSGVSISNTVVGFTTNTITVGSATTVFIASGSSINISEIRTDGPAVELGSPVGVALTVGTVVQITEPVFLTANAVLIGTGNTISQIIPVDSVVSISTVTSTSPAVIIESTTSQNIPDNSVVKITRIEEVENNLQIDALNTGTINATGIATIATVDINAGQIDVTRIGTTNLSVTGLTTLSNYVNVNSSVGISSNLSVTGISTFSGFVDINNSVDINVDLSVVGLTTLCDYVDINYSVGISSNLSVAGLTTLSGYVDVNCSIGVGHDLTVTDNLVIGGNVDIDDYVDINADLNVVGLTTLGGYVDINNSVGISSNLSVAGVTTLSGLTYPIIDGLDGQVLKTDGQGNLSIGPVLGGGGDFAIIVSASDGNDINDGVNLPVQTIKRAAQLASFIGEPATIFVESGDYVEENPIILYDDISLIGDSLRNVVIRPAQAGKDLIRVRNGCYLNNMTFNDFVDGLTKVPQHTWNYSVAFDDPYDITTDRVGYACTGTKNVVGATFDPNTGLSVITTATPHQLYRGTTARILGIGWTCGYDESGISTVKYTAASGITTVTTFSHRGYSIGTKVLLHNLPFSCGGQYIGVTTTIFPDGTSEYGRVFTVTGVNTAAKTLTFLAGISTIVHNYVGYNTAGISTLVTTPELGITTVTVASHNIVANDNVTLVGLSFTAFSFSNSGFEGSVFRVNSTTSNTITIYTGISTQSSYLGGGFIQKVPTIQKVIRYPESNPNGKIDFGVVSVGSSTQFTVRSGIQTIPHYYTQGGTVRLSKPIINKSPYIQNCSILSVLGGNGILVDGNKVANINESIIPELGERPTVGAQPEFGKSMVAATFTMISFGGIGWRTINDAYAQVVSCFQIFCRYASLTQSGGYLSITNSATNFGYFALRSTGFSSKSFTFDRGHIAATGTKDGLQTLKVIGLGRTDQDLYVLQFLDGNFVNRTGEFKPIVSTQEFTGGQISTITNIFNIPAHPFSNLDNVVYLGNEDAAVPEVIGGMVPGNQYYVSYIDASNFRLYQDEGLDTIVSLGSTFVGINTLTKNNQEFFVKEVFDTHGSYQTVSLASTSSTLKFISGKQVTQAVSGGNCSRICINIQFFHETISCFSRSFWRSKKILLWKWFKYQ